MEDPAADQPLYTPGSEEPRQTGKRDTPNAVGGGIEHGAILDRRQEHVGALIQSWGNLVAETGNGNAYDATYDFMEGPIAGQFAAA